MGKPLEIHRELLEEFDHSLGVSEYLVGALPGKLWRAGPPGGKARSIAAMAAHMQSVRRTFARMGGAAPEPVLLNRATATQAQAVRAFRQSRGALGRMFRESLERGAGRIQGLPRRTVNLMIYLMEHEAHHRGQISALARALGHRLGREDVMRVWGWKKLP